LNSKPKRLYLVSIASLVVPAISVTTNRSSPIKALINDDFPALGRPTTQKRGNGSTYSETSGISGNTSTNLSNNSPVPLPLIPEMV